MESGEELTKRENRGILTRGWFPHMFDMAKGFLVPAFLKDNTWKFIARKEKFENPMPFQEGIPSIMIGSHTNFKKTVNPNTLMPDLPITLPWKVLEKIGIPSVVDLMLPGPALSAPAAGIQHTAAVTGVSYSSTGEGQVEIQEYGPRRVVSAQLSPNAEINRTGRPRNEPGVRFRQVSLELPSNADQGPVHKRENLPRPATTHRPRTITRGDLETFCATTNRFPDGTPVDGIAEVTTTSDMTDSAREPLAESDSVALKDLATQETVSEIQDLSVPKENTSVLSTRIQSGTPTTITQSIEASCDAEVAHASTERSAEMSKQITDASVQGVITATTSTETQCTAETAGAFMQTTSELSTQTAATQVPGVETVDIGIQAGEPTPEFTTQTVLPTPGTQSCRASSMGEGTQITCEVKLVNAMTQSDLATHETNTMAETEPEDDSKLAEKIIRMVETYAARQMPRTEVHSSPDGLGRIEEEVNSFLSRIRGVVGHKHGSITAAPGQMPSFLQTTPHDKPDIATDSGDPDTSLLSRQSASAIDARNTPECFREVASALDAQPSSFEETALGHIEHHFNGSPTSLAMKDINILEGSRMAQGPSSIEDSNVLKRLQDVALALDVELSISENTCTDNEHRVNTQTRGGTPASSPMEDMGTIHGSQMKRAFTSIEDPNILKRLQDVSLALDVELSMSENTFTDNEHRVNIQRRGGPPASPPLEDMGTIHGSQMKQAFTSIEDPNILKRLQDASLALDVELSISGNSFTDNEHRVNTQTRCGSPASPPMEDMGTIHDSQMEQAFTSIEDPNILKRLQDVSLAVDVELSISGNSFTDNEHRANIETHGGPPASPPMEGMDMIHGSQMEQASTSIEDPNSLRRLQDAALALAIKPFTVEETSRANGPPISSPTGHVNTMGDIEMGYTSPSIEDESILKRLQDVALALNVQLSTSKDTFPDHTHRSGTTTRNGSPAFPARTDLNSPKGIEMAHEYSSMGDTNILKRLQDAALTLDGQSFPSEETFTDLEYHINNHTRSGSPTYEHMQDENILGRLQEAALTLNAQQSTSEKSSPDLKHHLNIGTRNVSPVSPPMDNAKIPQNFKMAHASSSIDDTNTLKCLQDAALALVAQPSTSEIYFDCEDHFFIQMRRGSPISPHMEDINVLKDLENVALALGGQPSTSPTGTSAPHSRHDPLIGNRRERESETTKSIKKTFLLSPLPHSSQRKPDSKSSDTTTNASDLEGVKPKAQLITRGTFDLPPIPDHSGTSTMSTEALGAVATRLAAHRGTFDSGLGGDKPKTLTKWRGTFDLPHILNHSGTPAMSTEALGAVATRLSSHRGTFDSGLGGGKPNSLTKCRGTFDLPHIPDHSEISAKTTASFRAAAIRRRGTFCPVSVHEVNAVGGAGANTSIPTYEDEQGWTVPDMEVPILDEDCIEWNLQADGVSHVILGTGSFGSVEAARYKATDGTSVNVAIKIYKEQSSYSAIIREAKMLQYTQDTGIFPRFYGYMDIGVGEGTNICLVQECFGDGRTLADFVDDTENVYRLEPVEWLSICVQLAKGLNKIHEKNIRFNDLKENNILVNDSVKGRPLIKFIDVGISTYDHGVVFSYTDEELRKYADSFPPELKDGNPTTVLSDIYSLGMIYLAVDEKTTIPGLLNVAQSCVRPFPQHRHSLGGVITCLVSITRINKMF